MSKSIQEVRQELLKELSSLEQQDAQCRETMAKADAVKADAFNRLNAVHGAKGMVEHMLSKLALDGQEIKTLEEIARSNSEEGVE